MLFFFTQTHFYIVGETNFNTVWLLILNPRIRIFIPRVFIYMFVRLPITQIVPDPVYSKSYTFIKDFLPNYGVEVTIVEACNLEEYKKAIKKNTKVGGKHSFLYFLIYEKCCKTYIKGPFILHYKCIAVPIYWLLSAASHRSITAFQVKMNLTFHVTPQCSHIAISVQVGAVRQHSAIAA